MKKRKPFISQKTMSRRSLIEWLGRTAVLSLGGGLLSRCVSTRPVMFKTEGAVPDTDEAPDAEADTGHESAAEPELDASTEPAEEDMPAAGFPFEPGDRNDEIFSSWNVRTVDPQDLEAILAGWRLKVDGMVENPIELTFAGLVGGIGRQDQVTDFHCVEGWSVYDVPWNGVHMSQLFSRARPASGATHVTFHTIDGRYNESLPLEVALEPRTMLAYGIAGDTLPLPHGFPLRVVVPRLLGYKNAKYVERLELTDHAVNGFWVAAGYPYDGEVPESRLRPGKY
ncbi:MAG: molybdopterin-dependent oxidoreductase [Pseudomonadota bacterium]